MKLDHPAGRRNPGAAARSLPRFDRLLRDACLPRPAMASTSRSVPILDGAPFPDPERLEGVVVTGSATGVYDRLAWIDRRCAFHPSAYAAKTPMLGVCFGHQIIADALGGEVRKSEKGWGIGRHVYAVASGQHRASTVLTARIAVAASHQDQVIVAPSRGVGLPLLRLHAQCRACLCQWRHRSVQPHPEFESAFRRRSSSCGAASLARELLTNASPRSMPLDNSALASALAGFLVGRRRVKSVEEMGLWRKR